MAEIIMLAGAIAYNLYETIASGRSPAFVFLSTLGAAAIVLFAIASWESIAQRLRRRVLSGKELIDKVDEWLRGNKYTRGPFQWETFTHGLQVSRLGGPAIWIGVSDEQATLTFVGARSDIVDEMGKAMSAADAASIKLDLDLEVARIGAMLETQQTPTYSIAYSTILPVDENLNSAHVLDRVMFIERVDFLVMSVYQKNRLNSSPATPGGITAILTPALESTPDTAPPRFPAGP